MNIKGENLEERLLDKALKQWENKAISHPDNTRKYVHKFVTLIEDLVNPNYEVRIRQRVNGEYYHTIKTKEGQYER